jgi:putative hydrolase of the HAD superfamily
MRRVVSFDLDGVLIQNPFKLGVGPHLREHVRAGTRLAGIASEEADRRIHAAVAEAVAVRMGRGDLVAAYDWDAIFSEVSVGFGAPPVPDVAGLVRHYCTVPGVVWLLEHAGDVLDQLSEAGYRLIATTNGFERYQLPVLEALGIADRFDRVLAPDTVGFAKPDPRVFAAVDGIVAHVGDMLFHDVLVARRAGIGAVWVSDHLPPEVGGGAPAGRTADPRFKAWFAHMRDVQPYRSAHPEAEPAELLPHHVVRNVGEVDADLIRLAGEAAGSLAAA